MNTRKTTGTKQHAAAALAFVGLALSLPVHAAHDLGGMDFQVIAAANRDGNAPRQDRQDERRDRRRDVRNDAEPSDARNYGYGFERREHQRFEDGGRPERRTRN